LRLTRQGSEKDVEALNELIIGHIEASGGVVLDKANACIDQVEGVKRAFDLGFKRIAVSVTGFQAKAIDEIRRMHIDSDHVVLILSICNTCICNIYGKHLTKVDIVCASASKTLRNRIGKKALAQLGVTIPVYALTERGKRLMLAYFSESNHRLVIFRTSNLPYQAKRKGPVLRNQKETKTLKCS
jgi:hypothetical protein